MGDNLTTFTCDNPGCADEREWDCSKGHVPTHWNIISVMGERKYFCGVCSQHFSDKIGDNGPDQISDEMKFDLGIEE